MEKFKQDRILYKGLLGVAMLLFLLAVASVSSVQAASATITISTEMEEIHVGEMVEIKLTISADATIGDFEAFLTYDDSILEFYSAASCITGGAGSLRIFDEGASPSIQDRTYRIYFHVLEPGECEIALSGRPVIYGYTDGQEMSVTGVSKTFTFLPSLSASDNNRLSALYLIDNRMKTVVLSPAFSSDTEFYEAVVPLSSDSLIVSAIAEDSTALVEVTKGQTLQIGENEVAVTVTAENGSKRVYQIQVTRLTTDEEEKTEEPIVTPEPVLVLPEAGVILEKTQEQVLVTEYHTYTVSEKPEDMTLPDGYVQTVLWLNGVQITAYAKQETSAEEFLLLVLKNEAGEVNWYRYDRIEQTLQRVKEEEYTVIQVVQSNEEAWNAALQEYQTQQTLLLVVIAVLSGVCVLLLIMVIWFCIRHRNRG